MNKYTILIIDDEPHILTSLKRLLSSEDREIFTAESAEKAWEVLKEKGEVEVILCDQKLPGISGIDFLLKVKMRYPDTIRILVTGYPDLNSAMEAINKAHIWRYILKPIDPEELKILLKHAFDYYRVLKENRLLLQVARQQAEWIKVLREKHPEAVQEILKTSFSLDEKKISQIISEFMKKYSLEGEK